MSGSKPRSTLSAPSAAAASRLAVEAGAAIRAARRQRRWTLRRLAESSGIAVSSIHRLEAGRAGSLEAYARIGTALGLRAELAFLDDRRPAATRQADGVHAWMGDAEAGHFQRDALPVAIDEPYQHYQFAGRGDVVSWSLPRRAFLHIENRTQFPNLQEAAGSYNAKREYLARSAAQRIGLRAGWASITHVMVCLWSGEIQHLLRLRTASFRALCPDSTDAFAAWWAGTPPATGVASCLVLFDPRTGRARGVGSTSTRRSGPSRGIGATQMLPRPWRARSGPDRFSPPRNRGTRPRAVRGHGSAGIGRSGGGDRGS